MSELAVNHQQTIFSPIVDPHYGGAKNAGVAASLVATVVVSVMVELTRKGLLGVAMAANASPPPVPAQTRVRQRPAGNEIGELKEQLLAQQKQNHALNEKLVNLLSALTGQVGELKKEVRELQGQVSDLTSGVGGLQSQAVALERRVEDHSSSLPGVVRDAVATLQIGQSGASAAASGSPAEVALPDAAVSADTPVKDIGEMIAGTVNDADSRAGVAAFLQRHVEAGNIRNADELREIAAFVQHEPPEVTGKGQVSDQAIIRDVFSKRAPRFASKGKLEQSTRLGELKKLVFIEGLMMGDKGIFQKDYSWDDVKAICGPNIIVPGGGGHGDVFFIKDTPYTVKQRLNPSEAKTYKHLHENGGRFFRKPFSFDEDKNFVVIRNALWSEEDGKLGDAVTKDKKGSVVNSNLFDFKVGREWMYKSELRYNGDERPDGDLDKKYDRVNAMRGGDKEKQFGLIERGDVYVDGKLVSGGRAMARMPGPLGKLGKYWQSQEAYAKTESILATRINGHGENSTARLTDDQLASLVAQADALIDEAGELGGAFVGSSVMMAFPDGREKMPQLVPIDFAHATWESDVIEGDVVPEGKMSRAEFDATRSNYLEGLIAIRDNLSNIYKERVPLPARPETRHADN